MSCANCEGHGVIYCGALPPLECPDCLGTGLTVEEIQSKRYGPRSGTSSADAANRETADGAPSGSSSFGSAQPPEQGLHSSCGVPECVICGRRADENLIEEYSKTKNFQDSGEIQARLDELDKIAGLLCAISDLLDVDANSLSVGELSLILAHRLSEQDRYSRETEEHE